MNGPAALSLLHEQFPPCPVIRFIASVCPSVTGPRLSDAGNANTDTTPTTISMSSS